MLRTSRPTSTKRFSTSDRANASRKAETPSPRLRIHRRKGVPSSSGEKSAERTRRRSEIRLRRGSRHGSLEQVAAPSRSLLLDRVICGDLEERRRRLRARNVGELIGRLAEARIAALAHHHDLQVRGIPALGNDDNWLLIANLAGRNLPSVAGT